MQGTGYSACNHTYNCGNINNIAYPFWGQNRPPYGGCSNQFELTCQNDTTFITVGQQKFTVVSINPEFYSMKLVQTALSVSCPWNFANTSLDPALFRFDNLTIQNLTLFHDCPPRVSSPANITCHRGQKGEGSVAFFAKQDEKQKLQTFSKCKARNQILVQGGISDVEDTGVLNKSLRNGFVVQYVANWDACLACNSSGGICGADIHDAYRFACHCRNGIRRPYSCPKKRHWNWKGKLIAGNGSKASYFSRNRPGGAAASFSVIVMSIGLYFYRRRKKNRHAKSGEQSQGRTISSDSSINDAEKGSKYFGVHLFTYTELEEATNSFDSANELGDGGFGTVYCGKLGDGRTVAVKRLYENNGRRVEQFMNEVEILTRVRHQNLVQLYGCTSRHSRELLLVYEYIPNGTVADHLHGQRAKPETLPWHTRVNIAIETASGLAYLHASDIIHRDIKTTNILLDNHFVVKVADFGLSRLFPNDVTHISTAPQGTPGYVDPEYHQCYQLTDKSDVYSFGVVFVQLISSMPAIDITRHRHEINLAAMAINKIQSGNLHDLVDPTLGFEADSKVRKMINGVAELAFRCLQTLKDTRPCMEEVVERLKEIQSDGTGKTKAEEMDISADHVVLLKNEVPPLSPDSNMRSTATTPNASE
ncbi:LEAF RUST 10 DISEASE-RESISTANCE LOCUS RECEPTOR-LIKE PROTEIN KINASE-like 1.2 [Prosopis cineraria]|uniref:LEAF RUST 10 DISEASE-RESISTANCE LOCUS RECEPTOR-LIKE PROTEIN KINASE-like 1.2 n=1 Tax=Prosopis cineraria TaxID=364024 RepID=UPI0024102D65|nr:LEAF RUST 10 DISEASE-RESISTANCE LOCUS RECEPTOR-LIKE PROTEIN KINASE-like 1.2 [Prosopis cineraria]